MSPQLKDFEQKGGEDMILTWEENAARIIYSYMYWFYLN